jgi:hypothetical protein
MRRSALALTFGVTLLTAACSRNGMQLAVSNKPADPSLLLSCARSVASERGLGEITQNSEAMELQAKSAVDVAASGGTAPSYDLLTVKLSPARKGLRMLVGSASYALRQLRSGGVGSAAQKSEWVSTSPSTRVALVRDAVLDQCGTIGD